MAKINPLEEMVERFSDMYVDLVFDLTQTLAPVRPWWHSQLSPDQQLWRWVGDDANKAMRDLIMPWLATALASMGYTDSNEALNHIAEVFTSPAAVDLIPVHVVAEIPVELLEMVQATGPTDAANHIRKMERMVEGRLAAAAVLQAPDQPDVPELGQSGGYEIPEVLTSA